MQKINFSTRQAPIETQRTRPQQLCSPLPDSFTILVNLPDSVERNPPKLSGFVQKFKSASLTRWKSNLVKWDTVNPALPSIQITDLKLALAKLFVVTDSAHQFVDRRHGWLCDSQDGAEQLT